MPHQSRETTMEENFEGPREAIVDGQEFIQHSLPDQIKMDNHLASKGVGKTGKTKWLGTLVRRFSPPGTV